MKDTKYIFPAFSFYDRTGIQEFLEKKARDGWMLEKMGGLTWKFRRIEPKKVHFAVTYFPKASAFDPAPSEQQEMFNEFCAHSGWNLAASSAQLQIFCNEQENPVPIETDPEIELENIHKTAKKIYLPAYYMLLPVGILPWLTISMTWRNDPVSFLATNIYFYNILTSVIDLLLCGTELFGYYRWRAKAKRAAADGEFVPTRGRRYFQIALVVLMVACLAILAFNFADMHISLMMLATLLLLCMTIAASVGATKLMKKMKVPARTNKIITYVLIGVLSLAATGLGTFGVVAALNEWNQKEKDLPTYEFHGETWTLYQDEIPLKVQDLTEAEPEVYSYHESYSSESLLVKVQDFYQRPRFDRLDQPDIQYTIVGVKADFLYDFCLNTMLEARKDAWSEDIYGNITYDEYRQVDAAPWSADAAYQEYNGEEALDQYLLCYGNLIIELNPDLELTADQMAAVGAVFR